MMGHMGTHGAAPALYPNLKYDPTKDFDADRPRRRHADRDRRQEGFPGQGPQGLRRRRSRTNGDKVNQAHAGVGSVSHIDLHPASTPIIGAKPTLVAYRGTGPALNDLVAGQVDFMRDQIVNVAPQIKAGTIKAYAIATPERSPALPDVPTTKEAGLPDYEVSAWNAIFAPKGTPPDDRRRSSATRSTRRSTTTNTKQAPARSRRRHPAPRPSSGPAALQKLVESEVARWTPVLKAAGRAPPSRPNQPIRGEWRRAPAPAVCGFGCAARKPLKFTPGAIKPSAACSRSSVG